MRLDDHHLLPVGHVAAVEGVEELGPVGRARSVAPAAGLAGIRPAEGAVAYRSLVVEPKVVGDLTFVKGSCETPQGTARSEWHRRDGRFTLAVTVPPNTTAEIRVPLLGGRVVLPSAGGLELLTE
ncbi:alpha-L-rhamnosidase C-terminal domain-containing protein [Lentzea sp. NPDC005914]|uniref:alpha-L-rhamnosidase C-terminal domain-containing protein n=1 Tax=Lentzea sp. NPDC005914 TaxID=3154572 RepID=UPI003411E3A1